MHSAIYDYVIVGSGSAGSVLAERLSASGKYTVLVLEAGGTDNRFFVQMPIGYGRTFFDPKVNWMYDTEEDPETHNRSSYWPRGKIVGGSSSINALVYVRGARQDFNDWEAAGNAGWGWDDVLPHFKAIENQSWGEPEFHGTDGPINISDVSSQVHPLCKEFVKTSQGLGFSESKDFNGSQFEGVGVYSLNTRNGLRCSAAAGFLKPALKRSNLQLLKNTLVHRITFEGNRANGIVFERTNTFGRSLGAETIRAHREVILCAGAVNSPQLLQLSGVGCQNHLNNLGINPISDLPAVGKNMQDHLGISYFYKSKVPTLNNQLYPWYGKLVQGIKYVLTRSGPLSLSVNQSGGFVRSDSSQDGPNIQLYFNPVSYTLSGEKSRKLMNPDPFAAFLMGFNSCRPTSRGSLEIKSSDPTDPPKIVPNYLSTAKDLDDAIAGCKLVRLLANADPLKGFIDEEYIPGKSVSSDEEMLEDFRERSGSVFHPVGTCAMGPDDKSFVVNEKLQVHGTRNLRVVDASIFPNITSGNTNAPSMMVGSKGAELILNDQ